MSAGRVLEVVLDDHDRTSIAALLRDLAAAYPSPDDQEFLVESPLLASRLPVAARNAANRVRRLESGGLIVRGNPVAEGCGPTPQHWRDGDRSPGDTTMAYLTVLYGALLGDVFGWGTQQEGRLVHDVMPIKEYEGRQLGCAPDVFLEMHTEDAFHHLRPDWVVLLCMRNPQGAGTTLWMADSLELSDEDRRVLTEERFTILPDESHRPAEGEVEALGTEDILRMQDRPEPVALLWGDPQRPYVRIDESFWAAADPGDTAARRALDALTAEVHARAFDVHLGAGDVLLIDNHKCAHGRRPYEARYDGTDRWLKRVCVTGDLRRSRTSRTSVLSQIVG